MGWFNNVKNNVPDFFDSKQESREVIIRRLVKKYRLENCYQETTTITLHHSSIDVQVPRVKNTLDAIKSLLYTLPTHEPSLMNYVNENNILQVPTSPENISTVSELHTGYWFSKTFHEKFCKKNKHGHYVRKKGFEKAFLLPIILQIDELKIDNRGKIQMEPILMSLSLPKRKIRNLPASWRPIGYIPNLDKQLHTRKDLDYKQNLSDYNQIVGHILQPLADLQTQPFYWKFIVKGKEYIVKCYVEVQFLMGDCVGNDKPCGRKKGYNTPGGICRICNTPLELADIPTNDYVYHSWDDLKNKSLIELTNIGMHKLTHYGFKNISFGYLGKGNIFMASPNGPLHQLKEKGIFGYSFDKLVLDFDFKPSPRLEKTTLYNFFQKKMQKISDLASRMSTSRDFPRLHFPLIDLSSSASKGDDSFGLLLIAFLALYTSCSHDPKFTNTNTPIYDKYMNLTQLFHDLLLFYRWLILKKIDVSPDKFYLKHMLVVRFMERIKTSLDRQDGNGMKIPKFHQLVHVVFWMFLHGSWLNLDEGVGKRLLRYCVKSPAQKTQRRIESVNIQASNRLIEELAVLLESEKAFDYREDFEEDEIYFENEFADYARFENAGYDNEDTEDFVTVKTSGKFECYKDEETSLIMLKFRTQKDPLQANTYWSNHSIINIIKHFMHVHQVNRIFCYTEVNVDDRHIYRVHPNYRGGGLWQNFVEVKYNITNDHRQIYPARLEAIFSQTYNDADVYCCVREMQKCVTHARNNNNNPRNALRINICEHLEWTEFQYKSITDLRGNALVIPDGIDNSIASKLIHVFRPCTWGIKFRNINEAESVTNDFNENFEDSYNHFEEEEKEYTNDPVQQRISENYF